MCVREKNGGEVAWREMGSGFGELLPNPIQIRTGGKESLHDAQESDK